MKIRTEKRESVVTIQDATFRVVELSTSEQTEIAIIASDDRPASMRRTFELSVKSWSGIQGQDGKEFPYTPENILLLYEANSNIVEEVLSAIPGAIGEAIEEQKKISKDGAGGI